MELISFWVINPADGQDGKPEPLKLILMENGDVELISLSEETNYRGAYKLPCGSYSYTGDSLMVSEANLPRMSAIVQAIEDDGEYRSKLFGLGLVTDREWDLFYGNRAAWKSLRIVPVTFGDD